MKSLFVSLLLLTSCVSAKSVNTGWFSSTAIKGYDSVAYFTEGKAVKGSNDYKYNWDGAVWKFSSKKNLNLFKTNPKKYAPQYGGYCAYAMADGSKVGIDPNSFDVKNGKLYLNYSKDVQEKWKAEVDDYIEKADEAWKKVD